MAERIRAHDWGATPLGPVEVWPQSLKTVVDLMLCSKQPVYIAFGPSLTSIYNDGYIPFLGTKHPEALGRPYREVWAEIWEQSEPLIAATMAGEAQHFVDHPVPLASRPGLPMSWFTFSWTPLRNDAGIAQGFYCSASETTDQVHARAALLESEERLRFVTGRAQIGYWYFDIETNWVEWSPDFKKLFGISEQDTVSYHRFLGALHPEDRERIADMTRACLKGAETDYDTEFRVVLPDGSTRWIHAKGGVLTERDRAVRMTGVVLDITARKQAEHALRRSELRYRQLVEQMTDGLFVNDPQGHYIDVSTAGRAMLGMTRDEIIGKHIVDVLLPEEHDRLACEIARFDHGGVHTSDWRFRRKDGSVFIGEVTGRRLPNGNLQAVLRDITERKRHEERIHLLIGEVNHRAKNMLTVVQAVARQTIASSPDDFIERFGERIQALAASQDLLVKNRWGGVGLAELVSSQLAHFRDLIGTRIAIKGPPVVISAAAAQTLSMAVHELGANASKYGALSNAEGRIRVEWDVKNGRDATFEMIWREQDGPSLVMPSHRGFGSRVICDMAEMSLSAKVDLDFAVTGLSWRLRCSAADVLEGSRVEPAASHLPSSLG